MNLPRTISHVLTHHRLLQQRLKRRLVAYPVIALIMFGVVIYDAIIGGVSPLWILVGGLVGLGIGYLVGHIFKVYWREDISKVVMGIDRLSVILIIAYIVFRIGSEHLLQQYLHGQELSIVTYSLLAGLLTGRMIGILQKAGRVLEKRHPGRHAD